MSYKEAGVDIEQSEQAIQDTKSLIYTTYNKNVLSKVGSFAGMYQLPAQQYKQPVLVSSTDGVGTKLKVAFLMQVHNTIGEDLVNHCVNDIAVCGARPLFFLDYFATGGLVKKVFADVLKGFVRGCEKNKCSLIGGETAEMPDMYKKGEYDLSGTILGIVERDNILDGLASQKGDILVGVNSNGLHTNGYSLARKVLLEKHTVFDNLAETGTTIGEELLKIHISYLDLIQSSLKQFKPKGIAHITGGGIVGNTTRLLKKDQSLKINWDAWERPPIFNVIQTLGNVPEDDMRRAFNLGIGLAFIISKNEGDRLSNLIENKGYEATFIGEVE
jgi:phosphoribosylformylglycinamidine cyclo-ligase